jgi:hypothetical protein
MTEMARCSICGAEHPLATMVTGHRNPEDLPEEPARRAPDRSDWWLQDGEALHEAHPRSFFIPAADRRRALRPDDLVRLGFAYGPHADREGEGHIERMWVQVLGQDAAGRTRELLRNCPARLTELRIGDGVTFEPQHVLSIDYTDEELGYAQDEWPVVDEAVLRDDRPPDVVVRAASPDAAVRDEWWMLCRHDTAGPTRRSVNDLTDRFPGLAEPLRARSGLWTLAPGASPDARWCRVSDGDVATSEEWQTLLASIEDIAQAMRDAAERDRS